MMNTYFILNEENFFLIREINQMSLFQVVLEVLVLDYFVNSKDSIDADFQLDDELFSNILYEYLEVSNS